MLREETIALRDLLGLNLNRSVFTFDPSPRTLAQPAGVKDVLFFAIDFEGQICQPTLPEQFQLGVSILDTRYLQQFFYGHLHNARNNDDNNKMEFQNALQTYNLCDGPRSYHRAQRKFLFGIPEEMDTEEMNTKIQTLIAGRDVILVVHGGSGDLRFLDRLKISIQPLFTLDTQKTAQNPLRLSKRSSLESFLTAFKIPFIRDWLHNGGNDANFTLRSLLMIAIIDSEEEEGLSEEQLALLGVMRGIARSAVPEDRIKQLPVSQERDINTRHEKRKRKRERKVISKLARVKAMEEALAKKNKEERLEEEVIEEELDKEEMEEDIDKGKIEEDPDEEGIEEVVEEYLNKKLMEEELDEEETEEDLQAGED